MGARFSCSSTSGVSGLAVAHKHGHVIDVLLRERVYADEYCAGSAATAPARSRSGWLRRRRPYHGAPPLWPALPSNRSRSKVTAAQPERSLHGDLEDAILQGRIRVISVYTFQQRDAAIEAAVGALRPIEAFRLFLRARSCARPRWQSRHRLSRR
jgi:hypothetical protein